MSRERVLVALKMPFRGDDLKTPATPDTSQAPQRGFLAASLYLCGAVGGIGGLAYGPADGGWAFAHQFAQPDLRASAAIGNWGTPPNWRSAADLVEVRLLLCSRALLGSDVNRSIRSAGRKRVGLAPAGPD